MDFGALLETAGSFFKTNAGVAALVIGVAFVLNFLFDRKPRWKKLYDDHGGTLIAAVKYAEKIIPDKTANKGLARLDAALKYSVDVLTKVRGKVPKSKEVEAIREALSVTHDDLEKAGKLKKPGA